MAPRKEIMKLARMIGGTPGKLNKLTEESPEYYALECVLDDEMAKCAQCAGLRKPRTVGYIAKKYGHPLEETREICHKLADTGVFTMWTDKKTGEEMCHVEIFAPGTLERMVGNREQLAAHPEIGRAFDEYTGNTGAKLAATLPMGSSLMRVIPIERSIEGLPNVEEYEKISYYLDKFDTFSVSDCSCRASRRIMGDGCGHLETDMCLHLGPCAEFYADTGKAHYVTKEEAKELLRRAEDNGLMHSIPNIHEPGDSDSICSCCACSCFGLRIGLLYGARDAISSNFKAEVDEEKCVACGQCVETCPGKALLLGQKLETKEELPPEPKGYEKITNSTWNEKKWDSDYRTNRKNTVETGTAPCKAACPAHVAVQGYLRKAAEGDFTEALKLIKKENPFPAVCGRICNHVCETECSRACIDDAVAIDDVKKFIADKDLDEKTRYVPPMVNQIGKPYDEKIAIIGSGPAGLTAAFFLAEKGYKPTVFEKAKSPGGMLMHGIPSFRLQKDVVKAEIDIIEEMGAEIKCGVEVGKDVTIQELRDQGYKGFFIAIGAQDGHALGIPGEDAEGVQAGVKFVAQDSKAKLKGKTVVVGGGNVAVDVARTAVRVTNDDVEMYCLEGADEMPAADDEVAEAKEEGVKVNNGWGPKEILTDDKGKVRGIVFKKCVSVFDNQGKFNPKYDEKETIEVECKNVLMSVGQSIDWGEVLRGEDIKLNKNGTIPVDAQTLQTEVSDIFAGGDVVTGPAFAIDAIAHGHEAAVSLHRAVHAGQNLLYGRDNRIFKSLNKDNADFERTGFDNTKRQSVKRDKSKAKTFEDGRLDLTLDQIKKETARCLKCGSTKVDEYLCVGCGLCTTRCSFDAIHLVKKTDAWGMEFERLPIAVAKQVVKRTGNIIGKKLSGGKE
ncbi:MAG: FAD-dependent oxidoreductase [Coriobacteriia bacterium]|nr:FAD-dependent oxidoreductase [Coriobacteriia bacterium]